MVSPIKPSLTEFRTAAVKFPEGTVAGCLKAAVARQSMMDVIRFNNQNINWTVKELD
jgi:hypothetical protein